MGKCVRGLVVVRFGWREREIMWVHNCELREQKEVNGRFGLIFIGTRVLARWDPITYQIIIF
jgi:hypothetical protein